MYIKSLIKTVSILGVLSILSACATNPVTGSRNFALSEDWELKAGAQYHQQIMQEYSLYNDPELQAYVDEIGQKLAAKSHRPDLKFTFTLLDSPQVNAFALPGGYVYVTRGIMAYMTEESHLAGVIGHEIGHVTARHGAQRAAQQQLAGVATIGAAILTGSQEVMQLSQMLGGALMSGYGRNQELESDRLGAEYIAKNNYDVEDMIGVIGILKDQELFAAERARAEGRTVQAYHGVYSTHPRNDQRLQEVVKAAKRFKNPPANSDDGGRFLRLTDGMAYGDSEAQGITRGNKFYHKSLDLFIEFPVGWSVQNTPTMLNAIAPDRTQAIRIQMDNVGEQMNAAQYLNSKFQNLQKTQYVDSAFGQAYTGVASVQDQRTGQQQQFLVSAVKRGGQAYVVAGLGQKVLPNSEFFEVAKNMRSLKSSEQNLAEGQSLKLITVQPGDTFSSLARKSDISEYPEETLRLVNGMYPDGELKAGQKLKLVR